MTLKAVARRYASALFDVAKRAGTLEKTRASLDDASRFIASNTELRSALESPAVSPHKKRAVVDALLAQAPEVGADVGRLLQMLAERDRLSSLPAIAAAFDERVLREQGVIDATLTTAVPMPADRQAALADALGKAAGDASKVRVMAQVDPALIGGMVARVGSVVYDGSVARQLEIMKRRLLADA